MPWNTSRTNRKAGTATKRRKARLPAALPAGERYTPARKAEFLLNNAVNDAEYRVARSAVRALGLDPDAIPHTRPSAR